MVIRFLRLLLLIYKEALAKPGAKLISLARLSANHLVIPQFEKISIVYNCKCSFNKFYIQYLLCYWDITVCIIDIL